MNGPELAFDGALRSWAWVEAQLVLLWVWIDEHGLLAEKSARAMDLAEKLEGRAVKLQAELGLTPQALTALLGSPTTVSAAGSDDGGLAALKAEGQRIIAACQAELGPVDAEEGS